MGARAYRLISELIGDNQSSVCFVEIGSERGEGSTAFIASYCNERGIPFYSVDVDQEAYERTARIPGVSAWQGVGEAFLRDVFPALNLRIEMAYLDNFDWIWTWAHGEQWILDQINRYRELGLTMTNENSQEAHLEQSILIERFAANRSLIILDDTWQRPDGTFDGKGGTATPWLLNHGYQLSLSPMVGEEVDEGFVALARDRGRL